MRIIIIKKKKQEERQNPGFLSLITPRDANGITKSSTSPGCVLAKNRCTHYYSRKPIRAAAGQRSSNTVSTRAARISTRWRLSDPRSQLWKFAVTSDDNSTVTLHCVFCFFFLFLRGGNLFLFNRLSSNVESNRIFICITGARRPISFLSGTWIPFGRVFIFHFEAVCKRQPSPPPPTLRHTEGCRGDAVQPDGMRGRLRHLP